MLAYQETVSTKCIQMFLLFQQERFDEVASWFFVVAPILQSMIALDPNQSMFCSFFLAPDWNIALANSYLQDVANWVYNKADKW